MSVSIHAALMASGCRCRAGGQAPAGVGLGRRPRVEVVHFSRQRIAYLADALAGTLGGHPDLGVTSRAYSLAICQVARLPSV